MDDKLNAALKGIYDSLTDEQKEKAKACKTMDELTALAAKEGIELPDEALDMVAGGAGGCNDESELSDENSKEEESAAGKIKVIPL